MLQTTGGLDLLTPREALASTAKVLLAPARRSTRCSPRSASTTRPTPASSGSAAASAAGSTSRLGIVGRPELLFLDEPTTGFDPQARRDVLGADPIACAADGTTILLTTHYLDEAEHLADRVGVIAAGRLLALDTPEALGGRARRRPRSRGRRHGIRRSVTTDDAHGRGRAARGPDADGEVPALDRHPALARGHLPRA